MAAHAYAATSAVDTLTHAEAVASGWNAATPPPATGWVPVKLMDFWTTRWPRHDGVVWYRLHWNQANADEPAGLLVDYVSLADKVWVNGSLVYRDAHLTEPLSRRWIAPQYFLIDKPVLRAGENTVLVRVSGLAAYQPGMGTVSEGSPEAVGQLYRHGMFWRYNIHLFNFAMSAVLGVLFLLIWLLRRRESAFGWYAITTLFGAGYAWNSVASSPWPFATTDAWEAMNAALFLATAVTFCVFLLRFCERRWRRLETILLAIGAASLVVPFVAPHFMGVWRDLWNVPAAMLFFVAIGIFLGYAVRTRRADVRVMAISLLLPVLASFRDLAVYLQWIPSSNYALASLTSPFTLIGMGFAVAWRFSNAMRRVEGFNVELQHEVTVATARLSETLSQQHALALANAHANERLSLVRDLHDGFGGSLVGAIALLEHDASPAAGHTVSTLKELRDDLRLVIDTTTRDADTDLAGLVAPLRRHWSDRFEAAGIGTHWRVEGIEGVKLGPARSLDLLRFLQEALTNVLKHSGAAHVDASLVRVADRLLRAEVRDDGRGFDPAAHATGAGLSSLRSRAARLGGTFALETAPGAGAALRLDIVA
jgi:signal transduction histidine kinase